MKHIWDDGCVAALIDGGSVYRREDGTYTASWVSPHPLMVGFNILHYADGIKSLHRAINICYEGFVKHYLRRGDDAT